MNLLRRGVVALLLALSAAPLAAQVPAGDRAWVAGDFAAADSAYRRALAEDPSSVRALSRLAQLTAWNGRLDSALTLIGRARGYDPDEPQLAIVQAQILSWAGRLDRADSLYREVLARHPENPAARAGRAEVLAWRGDLRGAERLYRTLLEENPRNVDALVGLAQVHYWEGDEELARREARRALLLAPGDRGALALRHAMRQANGAALDLVAGYTGDSDHNRSFIERASLAAPLAPWLRGFVSAALQQSRSPTPLGPGTFDANRTAGEAGVIVGWGSVWLTGAGGVSRLSAAGLSDRTVGTYRADLAAQLALRATIHAGFSHGDFSETADLISRQLRIDALDAGVELPVGGASVTLGGGRAWINGLFPDDHNVRTSAVAAVEVPLPAGFHVGAFGRGLGYQKSGTGLGYFAPDRYLLGEARAGWRLASSGWEGALGGGVGAQQVARGATAQAEWHVEARVGRHWGALNLVALYGSLTNDVASSTSGAYRYGSAGLLVRLGL